MKNGINWGLAVIILLAYSASGAAPPEGAVNTSDPTPNSETSAQSSVVLNNAISSAAVPTPAPTPANLPKEFSYDHLKGRWGIGVGSTPDGGNALDLRDWISDASALEFLFSGYNTPNAGNYDFYGNIVNLPHWGWGLGLGMKTNLSQPISGIFLQGLTSLTYSQNDNQTSGTTTYHNQITAYENVDTNVQAFSLFLGTGFEAFLPYFKNLSVEGNVGMTLSSNWRQNGVLYNNPVFSNASYSSTTQFNNISFSNTTFTILNFAVHYYF